jgi:dTDP-glucose 4,6-dehydratase
MNILVTGGAGFIGSCFVRRTEEILGDSVKIVVLDSLEYSHNITNLDNCRAEIVKGRIQDPEILERIYKSFSRNGENIDVLVNFAAETHVDRSIRDPFKFIDTNILGVASLLEFARRKGIAQFIQIGTDEVYGDIAFGESKEEDMLIPSSPYSASKASADLLSLAEFRTYGTRIKITRCTNNFGPGQHPEKLIPRVIIKSILGERIEIYGNGQQVREWIYVDDHVDAIWRIINEGKAGEIYNIGSGTRMTNIEIVDEIIKLTNSKSSIIFVEDRPGHDKRYALNSEKIRQEFSWSPSNNLKVALNNTIEYYQSKLVSNDQTLLKSYEISEEFYGAKK